MPTWDTLGKVRMTMKGQHDSTLTYNILDVVFNEDMNKLYIANKDVPVNVSLSNTEYWAKMIDVSDAYIAIGDSIATLNEAKTYLGIT